MGSNIVFWVVCIGLGIFLIFQFLRARNTASNARYVETSSVGDIEQALYDLGNLNSEYRHYCELKGILDSVDKAVIKTPFTKSRALFCTSEIIESYMKFVSRSTSDGKTSSRWEHGTRTIAKNTDSTDLIISDDTSANIIHIDTDNKMDAPITFQTTESNENGRLVREHGLRFKRTSNYKTVGYSFVEETFKMGDNLYILCEAYIDDYDNLHAGSVTKRGATGIVTNKTEEELIRKSTLISIPFLVLGILFILAPIAITIFEHLT